MEADETPEDIPTKQSEKIEGYDYLETGIVGLYQSIYDRVFWDLDHAELELQGPRIDFANLIHAAAHLRLVLERVATASFVASYELFKEAEQNVQGAKDFGEMRKRVRALNQHYWPSAFGPVEYGGNKGLGVISDKGLSESDVGRSFGVVSRLLHAPNPFRKKTSTPDDDLLKLQDLVQNLRDLLTFHVVQIADSSEFLYLRRSPDGEIRVQAVKTETPLL